jgi:hypothetical protein
MKIKSLYCGGGFIDSQLLWLIIVIDGYCNKNNIRNIIFERKLDKEILKKKKNNTNFKKIQYYLFKRQLNAKRLFTNFFFYFIQIFYYNLLFFHN